MAGAIAYQERALSSIILGMFLVKLTFFTILTSMFIGPTLSPQEAQTFSCNTFLISTYDYGVTTGVANDGYGDVSFQSTSSISNFLDGLTNLASCAFSPNDVETYIEEVWGAQIPSLISFFLFSFWANMLLFLVFIRTRFKV